MQPNINIYDNMIIEDIPVGDIFQIKNDERYFKCWEYDSSTSDDVKGIETKFYVYGYLNKGNDFEEIIWRLDYSQACLLAKKHNIHIEYSRVVQVVRDTLFMNIADKTSLKNRYGTWATMGNRYIAECKIVLETREFIRTGTAAIDNVHPSVISYAPNMACNRAVIKCIKDALNLDDIVEDFYEPLEDASAVVNNATTQDIKENIKMIDDAQLDMIKNLLKQNKKTFNKKKYLKFTAERAGKEITKLNKKRGK